MLIRLGSPTAKVLLSIGGFVLLFGGLLDAFSNAISIITPTLTYVLTAVVLVSIPIILILEKRGILTITYPDGSPFSIVDTRPLVLIAALFIIIWLPRFFVPVPPKNELGITTQKVF